jgi:hypothetical protein
MLITIRVEHTDIRFVCENRADVIREGINNIRGDIMIAESNGACVPVFLVLSKMVLMLASSPSENLISGVSISRSHIYLKKGNEDSTENHSMIIVPEYYLAIVNLPPMVC